VNVHRATLNRLPGSSVEDEEVHASETEMIGTFEGRAVGEVLEDDDSFVYYLPDPPIKTGNAFGVDLENTYMTRSEAEGIPAFQQLGKDCSKDEDRSWTY